LGISDEDVDDVDLSSKDPQLAGQTNPSHKTQCLSERYCNSSGPGEGGIAKEPPFVFPEDYEDSFASKPERPLDELTTALATWTTLFSSLTAAYKALAEILKAAEDLNTLKLLPQSISTLNDRLNRQLPIPRLVSKDIPLDLSKLSNTDKDHGRIYLFDRRETVKNTIENTSLRSVMHFGWGEIMADPSELWHGAAWWESMRASAAGAAHGKTWPCYQNGTSILFSDFVKFGADRLGRVRGMVQKVRRRTWGDLICDITWQRSPPTKIPTTQYASRRKRKEKRNDAGGARESHSAQVPGIFL
jgi:hypothetical protein